MSGIEGSNPVTLNLRKIILHKGEDKMVENYMVCNCKQVSYSNIADALDNLTKFDDVLTAFKGVQDVTNCSTGCGGCYQKVLDIISEIMSGATV